MTINSVYLSGWEYNRLLQHDPTVPRNSALPAEVLWNGAAEFWMFEKVYCTKESLDCERSCFEVLEWPTGRAFVELASRGDLVPVDWSALDPDTTALLRSGYAGQRTRENEVRNSIRQGKTGQLEALKIELLGPILSKLGCLNVVLPNNLRTWIRTPRDPGAEHRDEIQEFVSRIAAPVKRGKRQPRRGRLVCRRPGSGVSDEARSRQTAAELKEAPMIPDLFAGEGVFSGRNGYAPFHRELAKWRDDYRVTNEQLAYDWDRNRDELFRLRDAAAVHLWPQLHDEWLPRLVQEGSAFAEEFVVLLERSLRLAPLAKFLNLDSQYSVAVGSAAGAACSSLLYAIGALTGQDMGRTAVLVGGATSVAAGRLHDRVRRKYGPLALFYHEAIHAPRERSVGVAVERRRARRDR